MTRITSALTFVLCFVTSAGLALTGRQWLARTVPMADFAESVERSEIAPLAVAVATDNPPHLVIEQTRINRGEILRGEPARFVFLLRNDGPGPLAIAAKAGCGCTVVQHDQEIPAGGRSELTAELNTSKLQGQVTKSIDVQTNDPQQPRLHLELLANVVSAVEILPTDHPNFSLRMNGPTVHELQLRTAAVEPVEVTGVQCSEPYVAATLEPTGDEAGRRSYRLTLTFEPDVPPGKSDAHITLTTTAKHEPQITCTIRCEKGIIVSPTSVQLRRSADDAHYFQPVHVLISKRDGNLQITSTACNDPRLELQSQALKAGWTYRLSVTGQIGELAGATTASITIHTNDPDQPQLVIPVHFPSASHQ